MRWWLMRVIGAVLGVPPHQTTQDETVQAAARAVRNSMGWDRKSSERFAAELRRVNEQLAGDRATFVARAMRRTGASMEQVQRDRLRRMELADRNFYGGPLDGQPIPDGSESLDALVMRVANDLVVYMRCQSCGRYEYERTVEGTRDGGR